MHCIFLFSQNLRTSITTGLFLSAFLGVRSIGRIREQSKHSEQLEQRCTARTTGVTSVLAHPTFFTCPRGFITQRSLWALFHRTFLGLCTIPYYTPHPSSMKTKEKWQKSESARAARPRRPEQPDHARSTPKAVQSSRTTLLGVILFWISANRTHPQIAGKIGAKYRNFG